MEEIVISDELLLSLKIKVRFMTLINQSLYYLTIINCIYNLVSKYLPLEFGIIDLIRILIAVMNGIVAFSRFLYYDDNYEKLLVLVEQYETLIKKLEHIESGRMSTILEAQIRLSGENILSFINIHKLKIKRKFCC